MLEVFVSSWRDIGLCEKGFACSEGQSFQAMQGTFRCPQGKPDGAGDRHALLWATPDGTIEGKPEPEGWWHSSSQALPCMTGDTTLSYLIGFQQKSKSWGKAH